MLALKIFGVVILVAVGLLVYIVNRIGKPNGWEG